MSSAQYTCYFTQEARPSQIQWDPAEIPTPWIKNKTWQAHICVPFGRAENLDQQTCTLIITQNCQYHFELRIFLQL